MPQTNITPVILCGGLGTRLNPISTPDVPKQFLPFTVDQKSLFQLALERALMIKPARIVLVTTHDLVELTSAQILPYKTHTDFHLVIEPMRRNTAAAIGLCLQYFSAESLLWIKPSDHLIAKPELLLDSVRRAAQIADVTSLCLFGIPPTGPSTDYGYIRTSGAQRQFLNVTQFIEKPQADLAATLWNDGRHLWNSGMIVSSYHALHAAFQRHAPLYLQPDLEEHYEDLPAIPFDKAVLEKAAGTIVMSCPCGWQDMGSKEAFLSGKSQASN